MKDTTYASTDILSYNVTSEVIVNSHSYMPSSAGVNLCILSPDAHVTSSNRFKQNILLLSNRKSSNGHPTRLSRGDRETSGTGLPSQLNFNASAAQSIHVMATQLATHRVNTTPELSSKLI